MKVKFLSFVLAFILAVPILFADTMVEVIPLFEVVSAGLIGGDIPLDDSIGDSTTPTQPTDFCATIAGRPLAVTSGIYSGRVIVRNSAGTQVVNQTFVGNTTAQVAAGSYSIEIQSGALTLVGQFTAH